MATLQEYFIKDFNRLLSMSAEHEAHTESGSTFKILVRVHLDFDAAAKFVSIYVPSDLDPGSLSKHYVDNIALALNMLDKVEIGTGYSALGLDTKSTELVFTGRLFVYSDAYVPKAAVEQLKAYCADRDIRLILRDRSYANQRNQLETPEAFISHDSRDKQEVAEAIAVGLQKRMCPVWYDEFSLHVGDSLRESIERGIREARVCIVILSPYFLANTGWTKSEFNAIFTRELLEKKKLILPVWHQVSAEDVYEYSPSLADRFGLSTERGMEEVVRRLHSAIEASKHESNRS